MRPASRVQLVIRNGASVLVWSVGGKVLGSHTGGVLKKWKTLRKKKKRGRREKNREVKERQTCRHEERAEGENGIRAETNGERETEIG